MSAVIGIRSAEQISIFILLRSSLFRYNFLTSFWINIGWLLKNYDPGTPELRVYKNLTKVRGTSNPPKKPGFRKKNRVAPLGPNDYDFMVFIWWPISRKRSRYCRLRSLEVGWRLILNNTFLVITMASRREKLLQAIKGREEKISLGFNHVKLPPKVIVVRKHNLNCSFYFICLIELILIYFIYNITQAVPVIKKETAATVWCLLKLLIS